jgi:hypothetical protein
MKITLDIPDNTRCAFFDFVFGDYLGMSMQCRPIESDELHDGAVIVIKSKEEK